MARYNFHYFKSVNINMNSVKPLIRHLKGRKLKVTHLELSLAVQLCCSRAVEPLDVNVDAAAKLTTGEAVSPSGTARVQVDSRFTTPLSVKGYCMMGDFRNGMP